MTWNIRGKKKIVWRCTTRLEFGKAACPDSHSIEESVLHQAILNGLSTLSSNKDELCDKLKMALTSALTYDGSDISITGLEQQVREQENMMMRMVRVSAESGKKPEEFESEFKRISKNITDLKQIIQTEKSKVRPKMDIDSRLEQLFDMIDKATLDMGGFNDGIIRQLIKQIRVVNEEEISVVLTNGYRFSICG